MSFTETVDNLVNNLPYPDNSIAIIAYAPNPKYKRIDGNERNKRTSQQVAQALQRVYGIKEIPLATIDSVLHNKLRKLDMDGTLTVERINVNTNEVLASTNPQVSIRNFAAVTSETAFTFKSRGEAVRAILSFPAKEMEKKLLLLSFITWLLLGTAVYALIVQMKSVFRQRHDLQKQQQDFYTLAEEMKHPVSRMENLITTENWQEIEAQSNVLFERTNATLAHAKAEIRQGSTGRPISLKAISIVSLVGVFLLLAVWSGYLYYITSQKIRYQAEEQLEEAFYREADLHRYPLFTKANPDFNWDSSPGEFLPYPRRMMNELYKVYLEKGYRYRVQLSVIRHLYNKFDEDFRVKMAYDIQDTISLRSRVPIPFSLQFADSVFRKQLLETGFPDRADIRWIRYPSRELILYTGSPAVDFGDITTRLFPLDKDSTSCIFAVVRSPQRTIMSTTWYMQVPLLIAFLSYLSVFSFRYVCCGHSVGWSSFRRTLLTP